MDVGIIAIRPRRLLKNLRVPLPSPPAEGWSPCWSCGNGHNQAHHRSDGLELEAIRSRDPWPGRA